MWRQVLNIKCMKNDQNNPIHSFMNTKSIFLLSPQFFDNDHVFFFFFFFFFLSLQVTYLPKNSSKLNPDICALPDFSCCHSPMVRPDLVHFLSAYRTNSVPFPWWHSRDGHRQISLQRCSEGLPPQRTCARSCTTAFWTLGWLRL